MMKTTLSMAALLMLVAGTGVAHSQQLQPPANAEPLSSAELTELYSDRTWKWEDGAAYFAPDGEFHAVTGEERERTEATGTWTTRNQGRLCFRGIWRSPDATRDLTHCFTHVEADGTIYQREEPDRPWTVFRSPEESTADVYASFEEGDGVAAE
jgi:hypothetical protein